jgi:hypothetical protein
MSSVPERRRATRVPTRIQARLTGQDGESATLQLENLSVVGLHAQCAFPFALGAHCRVELSADGISIEARGTIVRALGQALALRFEELPWESYERLRAFLLCNAADPGVIAEELSERLGFLGGSAA